MKINEIYKTRHVKRSVKKDDFESVDENKFDIFPVSAKIITETIKTAIIEPKQYTTNHKRPFKTLFELYVFAFTIAVKDIEIKAQISAKIIKITRKMNNVTLKFPEIV